MKRKAQFKAVASASIRAAKSTSGRVGVQLIGTEYEDGTIIIKAIADGITVGITGDAEGKCAYMAQKAFARYEKSSGMLKSEKYESTVRFLDREYSLRDKTIAKLWNICKKGKNLMTKAEVKAESAAAVSAKPKAVKVAAAAVKA